MSVRRLSFLLAAVLALAGCDNGSTKKVVEEQSPGTTRLFASATTTEAVTAGPNDNADDVARAHKVVLRQSDVGQGWTSAPHEKTVSGAEANDRLASCVGRPARGAIDTADVDGPDLSLAAAGLEVETDVEFVKTADDARADFAAYSGPQFKDCFESISREYIEREVGGQGVTVKSTTLEILPISPLSDGALKFRLTVTVAGQTGEATLYFDTVSILKDRIEASATFRGTRQPFPADLEEQLTAVVAERVAAA